MSCFPLPLSPSLHPPSAHDSSPHLPSSVRKKKAPSRSGEGGQGPAVGSPANWAPARARDCITGKREGGKGKRDAALHLSRGRVGHACRGMTQKEVRRPHPSIGTASERASEICLVCLPCPIPGLSLGRQERKRERLREPACLRVR